MNIVGKEIDNVRVKKLEKSNKKLGKKLLEKFTGGAFEIFNDMWKSSKNEKYIQFVEDVYELSELDNREEIIIKLDKYSNEVDFNECIASILDSLFFSQSKLSRKILALITAKYLHDDECDYYDLCIINALKSLNDYDLDNFLDCVTNIAMEHIIQLDYRDDQTFITYHKLINNNIFVSVVDQVKWKEPETEIITFKCSKVSSRLKTYIEQIKGIKNEV